jgi:hypothetical protein
MKLHNELLAHLGAPEASYLDSELYAAAYRLVDREGQPGLDIWCQSLAVGQPLPTMPLWGHGHISLPVDLDATYERTCQEQRIASQAA